MKTRIEIVVPCFNEELILKNNIEILYDFLEKILQEYDYTIIIANNGSVDKTSLISKQLSRKINKVKYIYITKKGRGNALFYVWYKSSADIVGYIDADLSIDINTLPILIESVNTYESDIAIASRINKFSKSIGKSYKRTIITIAYSYIFRIMFQTSFKDAQCGMKVMNRNIIDNILPYVKDKTWFFDTELLILSEKYGYSIKEFPTMIFESGRKSKVNIIKTSLNNIKGLLRLRFWYVKKVKNINKECARGIK